MVARMDDARDGQPVRPADPAVREAVSIRALSHPLRLRLLEVLSLEGAATATRCAELVGESVASCSFHLRTLARHGFIERAPSETRERPYRLAGVTQSIEPRPDDAEAELAQRGFNRAFLDWEFSRLRARLTASAPAPWSGLQQTNGSTMWLTPEELRDLNAELTRVATRWIHRIEDPAQRPEGSRAVRLFTATTLLPVAEPPEEAR
jgi:DNA-binding transcriptional ArsR family regulator